jgi:predicted ribosome quality control (RQC) complex YloA/Tae2 family protein
MPFDALFLTAVRRELESSLTGCRVDKVQQPQRDTLILSMRGAAGGAVLIAELLCAQGYIPKK